MKRAPRKSLPAAQSQRGAVVVEMALILPFLLLLLVGTIDVSLLLREHQLLQNGAREGARISAQPANQVGPLNPTASLATIRQRVVDYLAEEGITILASDVTVNQGHTLIISGITVRASEVTVTYPRSPLIGFLTPGPVTLSVRSVFRNLY